MAGYPGILLGPRSVAMRTPLQRAAERLAERAVPVAHALTPTASATDASLALTASARLDAAYREAVLAAARDGVVARREERHLTALAEHLGIGARRALDLREEVERELTAGGEA